MASQRGKMFRSKLPSEPHNVVDSTDSEESEELDSTVSTLSVDEGGPNETQPETMPVSLKRAIEVVVPRRESKENARGKFPPKLI